MTNIVGWMALIGSLGTVSSVAGTVAAPPLSESRRETVERTLVVTTRGPARGGDETPRLAEVRAAATFDPGGTLRFLRVIDPDPAADLAPGEGPLDRRARAFFGAQRTLFGIVDAERELELRDEVVDFAGFRHVSFRQIHRGVPVFAGVLRAHFDPARRLRAVNGTFVPGITVDIQPSVTRATASRRALELARSLPESSPSSAPLVLSPPELEIYRAGLDRGVATRDHLVWRVEVGDGGAIAEAVFVDAHRGKVIDHLPRKADALSRRAFPGADENLDFVPDAWPSAPDWLEGSDPIPSGDPERDNLLIATGDFHARLLAGFGRDSWDGAGASFDVVYDYLRGCPNARAYPQVGMITACPGVSIHDVVVHEWTHLLTSSTSGLIYRWQSGALNESFSDIVGEALDQMAELPMPGGDVDSPGPPRSVGACSGFMAPAPGLRVLAPARIAGGYRAAIAWYGPPVTSQITGPLVQVYDGAGADPYDGCEPLLNGAELAGAIAFANRENCPDHFKTVAAESAGAAALVVGNVASSPLPEIWVELWCGDPLDLDCQAGAFSIPSVGVPLSVADTLRRGLVGQVTVSLAADPPSPSDDSIRWLLGEEWLTVVGLRDLWTPTCLGSPGKVSDADYYVCDGDYDNGGVHINSGIPNRAFALLVDGGTSNGVTVSGIGMVKALHVHYRAHTAYLVPTSGFADYAAALDAACADHAGAGSSLPDPWGGPAQVVTQGDCEAVAAASAAVELRVEPTFCGFRTLLQPDSPPLCANGSPLTASRFDWESGASGWTIARRDIDAPAAFHPRDWAIAPDAPGDRPGSAFHAPDAPSVGDCYAGLDQTGVLVLESPDLVAPVGSPLSLAFDHLVATEEGWDGGNVKLSVDGGPFVPLPAPAFRFNPPTGLLYPAAAGNTNPLADEAVWHGTDPGSNSGSWGRTIVRLHSLVRPGSTFRLRFEFGTDSCAGTGVGWWLDDVHLYSCGP